MITPEQLLAFFKNNYDLSKDFFDGWFTPKGEMLNHGFSFESVDEVQQHGGEGEGDQYWRVYKFVWEDGVTEAYLKFYGCWASYDGSEYSDVDLVVPVQVMKTEYHVEAKAEA